MWSGVAAQESLPKPPVGSLGRQSNSLNFKAEEWCQRQFDRLPFTARIKHLI